MKDQHLKPGTSITSEAFPRLETTKKKEPETSITSESFPRLETTTTKKNDLTTIMAPEAPQILQANTIINPETKKGISEEWAKDKDFIFPFNDSTKKLLIDCEESGECPRCFNKAQFQYESCLHVAWCKNCLNWATELGKQTQHRCPICDTKSIHYTDWEEWPKPHQLWEAICERLKYTKNIKEMDQHFEAIKKDPLCHLCLQKPKHQNQPCLCMAWCSECIDWASEVIKTGDSRCMKCDRQVTSTMVDRLWEAVYEKYKGSMKGIDKHLELIKQEALCHFCQEVSKHQNLPCLCMAWCSGCIDWASELIKTDYCRCIKCSRQVTSTRVAYRAKPTYDLTPIKKVEKHAKKKKARKEHDENK